MLTVYGIETGGAFVFAYVMISVATVLTVYGIETLSRGGYNHDKLKLQQCLPFTVLKHYKLEQLHTKLLSCNSAYRLRY